jgi:thioesterase domain-containing protein
LPIRVLFRTPTPAGIAGALEVRNDGGDFEVLLPLRPDGDRPPLFCVHPVEGISWRYAGIAEHLPPGQPLYGLQSRGLARTERLPRSIEEIAADYFDQIRTIQPDGPYHIMGWSLGGVIAHAIATHIQDQGEQVALLAILDGYPSFGPKQHKPAEEDGKLVRHGAANEIGGQLETIVDDLVNLTRRKDGRADVTDDIRSAIRKIIINNFQLGATFTPSCFHGDILLFVSGRGRPATSPAAEAPAAWQPYVEGRIESHQIDSDHQGIVKPRSLSVIGPVIRDKLSTGSETSERNGS